MNEIINKADELMDFFGDYPLSTAWKKQCAQYVCEQSIREYFDYTGCDNELAEKRLEYWQQVKTYIKNNY